MEINFVVDDNGVGVWMVVIFKNLSLIFVINICNKIGKCVILVGLIKVRFVGKRVGLNININ